GPRHGSARLAARRLPARAPLPRIRRARRSGAVLLCRPHRDGDGRGARAVAGRGAGAARDRREPLGARRRHPTEALRAPRRLPARARRRPRRTRGRGARRLGRASRCRDAGRARGDRRARARASPSPRRARADDRGDARRRAGRGLADRRAPPARAPVRVRAGGGVVRASPALSEARVRRRPVRGRAVRLAARARGCAAAAGAVDGARRVRGEPCDGAPLHDEPVRGRRARDAVRDASAAWGARAPAARARPGVAREVTRRLSAGRESPRWAAAATRSRSSTEKRRANTWPRISSPTPTARATSAPTRGGAGSSTTPIPSRRGSLRAENGERAAVRQSPAGADSRPSPVRTKKWAASYSPGRSLSEYHRRWRA